MNNNHQNQNEQMTGNACALRSTSEQLIAYCGLYCKACPSFTSGKCEGCRGNSAKCAVVYKSCQVRPCCIENGFSTCADCTKYASTKDCKKYNPLLLKIASRIEGTSRSKGIEMIRANGRSNFASYMEERGWVSVKTRDSVLNKRLGKRMDE